MTLRDTHEDENEKMNENEIENGDDEKNYRTRGSLTPSSLL